MQLTELFNNARFCSRHEKNAFLAIKLMEQNDRCYYCGNHIRVGSLEEMENIQISNDLATVEHLKPKGHPQRYDINQVVASCYPCNNFMGIMTNPTTNNETKSKELKVYLSKLNGHGK